MPTLQGRNAFGSGARSVGPPAMAASRNTFGSHVPPSHHPHHAFAPSRSTTLEPSLPPPSRPHESHPSVPASEKQSAPSAAPAAERPAAAPAAPSGSDYRDAFKASKTYSSSSKKDADGAGAGNGGARFRAAVEAERWRSRLSDKGDTRGEKDRLDSYRQQTQSDWMRERLLGPGDDADDAEKEDDDSELRARKAAAQAWVASPQAWVEVAAIDRLEEMLRRRLGELESTAAHAGGVARGFFQPCDPQRSGRILRSHFSEAMARKLNYDFPARGSAPSSRAVLDGLFDRYDLPRASVIAAADFHAALAGASRPGRASGRVINALGRLREGLVRCGGGYDTLLRTSHWLDAEHAKDRAAPPGCVRCSVFIDGLQRLAQRAAVPLSEADLVTICDAFEPPVDVSDGGGGGGGRGGTAAHADDPLVAYGEFVLAVRGPPMPPSRLALVKGAYAALKEDAKTGKPVKPEHIASRFDVSRHPAVLSGTMDEKEAALATIGVWRDIAGEEVTKPDFCDRYEWVSPLFEDDDDFESMMKAAWRLK